MKIAVVAYEMEGAKTGVGRYLEGLLSGVARTANDWRWQLYFKGDPFHHHLWSTNRGNATEARTGGPLFEAFFDRRPRARPILWEQLRLPRLLRRDRPDIVFSPAYSLPPATGAPGIVTVHDLSFELLGDEFSRKERWRRRLLARRAVKRARRVLTDTEEIARDLIRVYGVDYDKIGVVPLGLDAKFFCHTAAGEDDDSEAGDDADLEPYGIRRPYLLHLGSILERRHLELLIAAFSAVAADHPELTLVIAGRNRLRCRDHLERWIGASGVADRIRHVGYVREEDLALLYRRATLSFYLSSYEGYGLPPLESLAAGTPAIVSRGLALDELWPEYPYRALTLDRATVTRITRAALDDAGERRRVGREGARRMSRLDWKLAAELFLGEIRRL